MARAGESAKGSVWLPGAAWACVFVGGGGCESLPEVRYVTDRVELAPYFDAPVCRGTLDDLERFARQIEERTGLHRDDRIRFYWGVEGLSECVVEHPGATVGCAAPEAGIVFGTLGAAPHEFAHAIGGVLGQSTPLLEEGFALTADRSCFNVGSFDLTPSEAHELSPDKFGPSGGDAVGGSFASHLIRTFGRARFNELKSKVPEGASLARFEEAVLEVYGVALAELELRWSENSPSWSCSEDVYSVFDETDPYVYMFVPLTLSATLACDHPGTKGPLDRTVVTGEFRNNEDPVLPGMYADFTVVVPFAAEVIVSLDGPASALAYISAIGCWGEAIRNGEIADGADHILSGGESRALTLQGCAFQMALATPDNEKQTLTLHIDPVTDSG